MEIIKAQRLPVGDKGEWVVVGQSRWALWHHPRASSIGFARFALSAQGMWEVAELRFAARLAQAPVRANDLRLLALGRLESTVNDPEVRLMLESPSDHALPKIDPNSVSSAEALRACESLELRKRTSTLKLDVPPKGRRGAEWYFLLALMYSNQSAISRHPARDIAEANGVPVSTVHAWLKALRKYQAERDQIWAEEREREATFHEALEKMGLTFDDYVQWHSDDDPLGWWKEGGPDPH